MVGCQLLTALHEVRSQAETKMLGHRGIRILPCRGGQAHGHESCQHIYKRDSRQCEFCNALSLNDLTSHAMYDASQCELMKVTLQTLLTEFCRTIWLKFRDS